MKPTKIRYQVLFLIFVNVVINYMDRSNLAVAASEIDKEFKFTPVQLGLIFSAFSWTYLAFQVPGNFDEPSHTIRRELEALPEFAPYVGFVAKGDAHDANTYLRALTDIGCTVDAWETNYLHVLHGRDPVFEWVSTTSARPTLDALPAEVRAQFEAEFKSRLNDAYRVEDGTVVLPFRRVFVVARVPYWD